MLQDKLNAMSAASADKLPPETLSQMLHAKEALENSDILQKAIKVSENFPAFDLADANGNQVASQKLLKQGPMLITLFRGVW